MPIPEQARADAAALKINPEKLAYLDTFLQQYFREGHRQAGVFRVQRYGVPIFEGAYGNNPKPYGMRPDLIFPVASITKPVISALLLLLQEDGLVSITDPVWRYLPEFTGGGLENICLWHLLTHTSGLKDEELWGDLHDAYVRETYDLQTPGQGATGEEWDAFHEALRVKMGLRPRKEDWSRHNDMGYLIALKLPVNHKPRSHMTYCNFGFQVLKYVIDQVTGGPIDTFAGCALFGPLGMTDTGWITPEAKWPRVIGREEGAKGYPWANTKDCFESGSGSGGLKSTVQDMCRFLQMIINGGTLDGVRVLSPFSTLRMRTNYNADMPSGLIEGPDWSSWGLGVNVRGNKLDDTGNLRGAISIGHSGFMGTKIVADPETGIVTTLFTAEYEKEPGKDKPLYDSFISILYAAMEP